MISFQLESTMEDHKPDPDMEEEKDVLKAHAAELFDYQNEKALMRKIDWQYEILFITMY